MRLIDAEKLKSCVRERFRDLETRVSYNSIINEQETINPLQEVLDRFEKYEEKIERNYLYSDDYYGGFYHAIRTLKEIMKKYE